MQIETKNAAFDSTEKDGVYSYDEAVEMTGHGRFNYVTLVTCCVIMNAVAIDIFGFSVVVTAATCDLGLDMKTAGLLTSTPFAGILLAFPWGYFADTRGRRLALVVSTAVGFAAASLSSLAPSWGVMMGLKLVGSLFSTAAFTLTITYVGECTGSLRRSRYLYIINSANLAAEILFFGLAYFILSLEFNLPMPLLSTTYRPWRLYTLVLALPMGIGAVMMFLLPESPKFLASRGETEKALKVLNSIYEWNGGQKGEFPVKSLSTHNIKEPTTESVWSSLVKQTVPLFKRPLLWRTLQLFYLMAMCTSTNNVYLMWYPMMVNLFFNSYSSGTGQGLSFCERVVSNLTSSSTQLVDESSCIDTISQNTIFSGISLGVVFVSLNLAAAGIASRRRLLLIVLFLVSGICLILTDLVRNPVANLIIFTMIQCTAVGVGSLMGYCVDLYPTNNRGMVTSLAMMVARLVSLAGINGVGAVFAEYCAGTFYFWAVLVALALVATIFLPPDSKVAPDNSPATP